MGPPVEKRNPRDAPALSVYGYTSFRDYLRDFYAFRKESHRGYSYRAFSKAAGFSSPNVLKLVIEGKRNIGEQALSQFVRALGLNDHAATYFQTLVKMNQAASDDEKDRWFLKLRSLLPTAKRRLLGHDEHQYLSHWLYPVLREMAGLSVFKEDPYWIARRLVSERSPNEAAAALSFLLKEGFIARETDGRLAPKDNMVFTSDEIKNLAVRNYHRQMLDQARGALEALPLSEREFGALTLGLPEGKLAELKFKLKTFLNDIHAWAVQSQQGEGSEVVVQVNLQMYPHTRKVTE